MEIRNRNEYQRIYQSKWRKEHKIRFIESQLKYWKKKLCECLGENEVMEGQI